MWSCNGGSRQILFEPGIKRETTSFESGIGVRIPIASGNLSDGVDYMLALIFKDDEALNFLPLGKQRG